MYSGIRDRKYFKNGASLGNLNLGSNAKGRKKTK